MTESTTPPVALTEPTTPADAATKRHLLLVFAGLMVTMLLASLDQMIFSTALPTIVGELNGVNHMLWVTTAYILASTITLPVYGKLGDLIGRKGLFITAISIFIVGSIIGGLAHDMNWLIAGRAVQGLGGGGLMSLALAVIGMHSMGAGHLDLMADGRTELLRGAELTGLIVEPGVQFVVDVRPGEHPPPL